MRSSLRLIGKGAVIAAGLILLLSSQIQWKTPYHGILVFGHRTDVLIFAAGLILFGISLLAAAAAGDRRITSFISKSLISLSVLVIGLSFIEWYLRHPARATLIMPPQISAIEQRYVEPQVGFRTRPGQRKRNYTVPYGNIIWTKQDERIVEEERRTVDVYFDDNGFPNRSVPETADIIVLGDSFTKGSDVDWEERWVSLVEKKTKRRTYNISGGGLCPTQEVELYKRYGSIPGIYIAVLCIYGINDVGDERSFFHFRESGMSVKQWAYFKARRLYPGRTFGLVQLWRSWVLRRANTLLRGSNAPSEELEPILISNTDPGTVVSYYPAYQDRAYQCATTPFHEYPAARNLETAIQRFADLCSQRDIVPAVAYFPIKQTIHPPSPDDQAAWIEFLRNAVPPARPEQWSRQQLIEFGRATLTADHRLAGHLESFCAASGILFHSVIPALVASVSQTRQLHYYHFDTHWNERGHACAGASIADWLEGLLDDLEHSGKLP